MSTDGIGKRTLRMTLIAGGTVVGFLICASVLVFVVFIAPRTATTAQAAPDRYANSPVLTAKIDKALGGMTSLVDTTTATVGGEVDITLNQTTSALSGIRGRNGADKIGADYVKAILSTVPEAKSVSVYDADNRELATSSRP